MPEITASQAKRPTASPSDPARRRASFLAFWDKWDKKDVILQKQSGEVIENTGQGYINSQKQTGKQSGEVVQNTCLWKKQTGTNRKTNLPMLLKIEDSKNFAAATQSSTISLQKG